MSLGFQLPISLEIAGWSKVHGGREASVAGKCFNYDAPLEYFLLLQHHLTHMESYDEAFGVRHSQSKAYYDTLRTRFKTDAQCSSGILPLFVNLPTPNDASLCIFVIVWGYRKIKHRPGQV